MASPSAPAPPPQRGSQDTEYYYFFVAIAAIAVMLLVSNIIAVGCCSPSRVLNSIRSRVRRRNATASGLRHGRDHQGLIPLCKYRKGEGKDQQQAEIECSVCLSEFVEGEEVRHLPQCKHSFHAPCIDMWLYSHSNCPLCRADVFSSASQRECQSGGVSRPRMLPMEPSDRASVIVAFM
ncbi:hypothetical protein J5N97_014929 [Dioscorea zingiberensis]|uniref:RING-type E3 ubiquitin transferase n=1 Tax=Dioscorea zingiberensis TaxID=325984 RepID=A0A9D5HJZ5_9LILI|nr:hypothetical protein J5N97_014929 [Dioscorea zingiberensis]